MTNKVFNESSDFEVLKSMLARAKIEYVISDDYPGPPEITIYGGYSGFSTNLDFDEDGKLAAIGAYEG